MSGSIRIQLGPMVKQLRERIAEARPILDAQERTEEGIERLRKLLVYMSKSLENIEKTNEVWRQFIVGLEGRAQENEEGIYAQFKQGDRHMAEWMEDARNMITEIEILLAIESDSESKTSTIVEAIPRQNNEGNEGEREENLNRGRERWRRGQSRERTPRPVEQELPPMFYPKLPWPYFYGDAMEWPVFWQAFEANIDSRPISDTQKVTYLMLSLKGKAARVVKGYQMVAENYEPIIDALKRQFGNEKVLKEALQSEIMSLAPATEAVSSLRSCMEDIERICRQLDAMGQPEGDRDFVMMAIKHKFPREIVLEALRMEKQSGEKWGIMELRNGLEDIISLREEAARCSKSMSTGGQQNINRGYSNRPNNGYRGNRGNGNRDRERETVNVRRSFAAQNTNTGQAAIKCFLCGGQHHAKVCKKVTDRMERVRILNASGRCHKCLSREHKSADCTDQGCLNCGGQHNRIICPTATQQIATGSNKAKVGERKGVNNPKSRGGMAISMPAMIKNEEVLLMSARVQVYGGKDLTRTASVLVLFDSGSQISFISDKLIRKLSPPKINDEVVELLGIRQREPTSFKSSRYLVSMQLCSGDREELVLNRIDFMTNKLKRVNMESGEMELGEEEPDIMIGMAEFWRFFQGVAPVTRNLYKVDTMVGQIVCGQVDGVPTLSSMAKIAAPAIAKVENNEKEESMVKNFWDLEMIGVKENPVEDDDEVAMNIFESTVKKEGKRYVVNWPWKCPREELSNNFPLAYRRFVSLMDKLKKAPELLKWYDDHLHDQINTEIIEKSEIGTKCGYFLPYHVVVTPKKNRVVYDASAKVRNGLSLNDCLYRGEVILPVLPGLLIRFRMPKIAMWADIQSAFWTLQLEEIDREVTKFLWLKNVSKPISGENLLVLRFRRVPFGVISSPFLLAAAVRHHLRTVGTPLANEVENNIYVDNVLVGCVNEQEAKEKYEKMKILFKEVEMNLREFITNSTEVNEWFPKEDRLEKAKPKVLGLMWDIKNDVVSVEFPEIEVEKISRRLVLKGLASVFDPLGWATPCLLPAKLFLQRLWDKGNGMII